MSLNFIIELINKQFAPVFSNKKNIRIRGISELFLKGNVLIPGMKKDNEIEYLGADDKDDVLIYHRLNTSTFREQQGNAYGDDRSNIINTYNLGLYVIVNRSWASLDLAQKVQTVLPDKIKLEGFKSVILKLSNINFNSLQILRAENQSTDAKMLLQKTALLFNYQIETTYARECLSVCA